MPVTVRDGFWPADDEVQVWIWPIRPEPPGADDVELLCAEERARASRFVRPQHRDAFVRAHAGLRRILGRLLSAPPRSIAIERDGRGKPFVAAPRRTPLFFNLSHADELAALAVCARFEVGVDIERVRAIERGVAERFLSARERATLAGLSEQSYRHTFFRAWTRKEAYVKALGVGLAAAFDSFDVSLDAGRPPRLLRAADGAHDPASWQLVDVEPAPGYAGAVAAHAVGWRLTTVTRGAFGWTAPSGPGRHGP